MTIIFQDSDGMFTTYNWTGLTPVRRGEYRGNPGSAKGPHSGKMSKNQRRGTPGSVRRRTLEHPHRG